MIFIDALKKYPHCKIFSVLSNDEEDCNLWDIKPNDEEILSEEEGFFILKAKNIISKDKIIDCYIDVVMNERINDNAYFIKDNRLVQLPSYECNGDIISAVPIAAFGVYELFYSKVYSEIGINILKDGFKLMKNTFIAEDLAYILRDEGLHRESIKYFQYSADNKPSSEYIYWELAELYKLEKNTEKYEYYKNMFS